MIFMLTFKINCDIIFKSPGCSAVLVARLNGVQEAAGSTPVTRTKKATTTFVVVAFYFYLIVCLRTIEPHGVQALSTSASGG